MNWLYISFTSCVIGVDIIDDDSADSDDSDEKDTVIGKDESDEMELDDDVCLEAKYSTPEQHLSQPALCSCHIAKIHRYHGQQD